MAGELKATLRLTADGKGFIGEIRSADRSLDKLRGNTRRAASSTDRLSRSSDRAGRSLFGPGRYIPVLGHSAAEGSYPATVFT